MHHKFIKLFTDYGFKKIFGEEPNKDCSTEVSQMDNAEQQVYQESLKEYWDLKSTRDTYYEEGIKVGLIEGEKKEKIQMALLIIQNNEPLEKIIQYTRLTKPEIRKLLGTP